MFRYDHEENIIDYEHSLELKLTRIYNNSVKFNYELLYQIYSICFHTNSYIFRYLFRYLSVYCNMLNKIRVIHIPTVF